MQTSNQAVMSDYQRIGGDAVIRALVDRFYALMDELPEAYAARKIHPADLSESGNKLFDFLSGWLGGPQRYIEPRLSISRFKARRVRRAHHEAWIGAHGAPY